MKNKFLIIYLLIFFSSCIFNTNVHNVETDKLVIVRSDSTLIDSITIEGNKISLFKVDPLIKLPNE